MSKFVLYGLVIFLLIGVTLANKILATLGFNTNILLIVLVALVITRMIIVRSALLIATVGVITLLIYMPNAMHRLNVSPEILIATLAALLLAPDLFGRSR